MYNMAITVKDVNGVEKNVASTGTAGTALGLSIGALGTILLGGMNGLSGILGGTSGCGALSQKEFYEMELLDRDREFANFMNLQQQICELKSEVAINSTANTYQNMMNNKQFEWDRIATTYQINSAVCDKVSGQLTLPLNMLSNGFKATDNYLATYNGGCGYYGGGYCGF
jgi:4-hydroxyphenylpyruvate dioxygenase-like putative hemolysin